MDTGTYRYQRTPVCPAVQMKPLPPWELRQPRLRLKEPALLHRILILSFLPRFSPDYYFPGCGVLLQRAMKMKEIGALDVRNQCSGFLYALSVGDQFIKTGMYKNILVVGAEKHSFGLDFSTRGRNISVIFGDGAGAVVLQPTMLTRRAGRGILSTHLHSDGESAELLAMYNPGTHANHWTEQKLADFDEAEIGEMFMSHAMIDKAQLFPNMDGPAVFKKAVVKFPEVIMEALT